MRHLSLLAATMLLGTTLATGAFAGDHHHRTVHHAKKLPIQIDMEACEASSPKDARGNPLQGPFEACLESKNIYKDPVPLPPLQ